MSRILSRKFFVAALAIGCSIGSFVRAEDDADSGFKQAKRSIQTQLRSKKMEDRVAGFYRLKEFRDPEAAKLVLQIGLRDAPREVRNAAFETLLEYKDDPAVCDILLAGLKRAAKAKDNPQGADVLLAVLLSSGDEATLENVRTTVDKQLATAPSGLLTIVGTADALGMHAAPSDLKALLQLTKTELFHQNFGVMRAVVRGMMRVREPDTIDAMIGLLDTLKGEGRGDVAQYLAEITSQKHGLDSAAWNKWWKSAREKFEFPAAARGDAVLKPGGVVVGVPRYYDIPIYAQKLVFVFDCSGSMSGARLNAAKGELVQAIDHLPEDAQFGIVVFNSRVLPWQKKLVAATSQNKAAATRFVGALQAQEKTSTFDALSAAFEYDAEAVYLLTDGVPTTGRIVNPVDIVGAISRMNLVRRVGVYTIGIGVGEGAETQFFDTFLSELAAQNYGQYRRVN